MQDALLRRLADEEPSVVSTVLSLPSLTELPGSALYTALAAILKTCSQVTRTAGRKSEHKAWRHVARKVQKLSLVAANTRRTARKHCPLGLLCHVMCNVGKTCFA